MKLYQEMRIQAIMLMVSAIGLVSVFGLLIAGFVYNSMGYPVGAGILLVIVFRMIASGQRRAAKVMDRVKKIRKGDGDEADLEWIKSRKKQ